MAKKILLKFYGENWLGTTKKNNDIVTPSLYVKFNETFKHLHQVIQEEVPVLRTPAKGGSLAYHTK